MLKLCFVCLGNICRSPMAEFIMKDKIKKLNLENDILVDSRATSYEEQGNPMHPGTKAKLQEKNIPYTEHIAKRLEISDYNKYDYFICMDSSNIKNTLRIFATDPNNKIFKLLDITDLKRDVLDPWYTNNFTDTYNDLDLGTNKLLELIQEQKL